MTLLVLWTINEDDYFHWIKYKSTYYIPLALKKIIMEKINTNLIKVQLKVMIGGRREPARRGHRKWQISKVVWVDGVHKYTAGPIRTHPKNRAPHSKPSLPHADSNASLQAFSSKHPCAHKFKLDGGPLQYLANIKIEINI